MYIDLPTHLHKVIKQEASVKGVSLRTYILDCLMESVYDYYDPIDDKNYKSREDNWSINT